VRELNPHVHVVRTTGGKVDPALVYDVASTDEPEDELPLAALLRAERPAAHGHTHASSVTVTTTEPVDPAALEALLAVPPPGAYRIKGTVAVRSGSRVRGQVVHVVGRQAWVTSCPPPAESVLVAIGLDLDPEVVRPLLAAGVRPAR
jgi:G3E family GTPase